MPVMQQTILLVEDNPDDEQLMVRALKREGLKAKMMVAHDGAEAIELLLESEEKSPTLVLLDLKLPRIDGHEVLRRIRASEKTKSLPVVVLTNSRERKDVTACYAAGANSYIVKPVDFEEFSHAASIIGKYWLTLNEPPASM